MTAPAPWPRVVVEVPSLLRDLLEVAPGTVAVVAAPDLSGALPALRRAFPKLAPHLWDEAGEMRPHVHVYVGEWNLRWPDVPADAWHDGARIRVTMAVSGG